MAGVSLGEAEREVLRWFDPTQAPRILWSRYVHPGDLLPVAVPLHDSETSSRWYLRDHGGGRIDQVPLDSIGDPALVVAAGARALDRLESPAVDPLAAGLGAAAPGTPAPVTVLGVFDARTGELRATIADNRLRPNSLATLATAPSAPATFAASARVTATATTTRVPVSLNDLAMYPTLTPSPSPTPAPPRVTLSQVNLPADLAPTFRTYPLAPGSSWTWRVHAMANDVRWARQIVTETVVATWLEGENAVVETETVVQDQTPGNAGPNRIGAAPGRRTRYVTPRVILGDLRDLPWILGSVTPPEHPDSPFARGVAIEALVTPFNDTATVGPVSGPGGPTDVTTPAGVFHGCWAVDAPGGNGWGAGRTFCPGVGFVRHRFTAAGTRYHDTLDAELLRWRRTVLPER